MSARANWLLGFGLFFGLPAYFSGLPFGTALLVHLAFIAVYVLLLRDFGGDSCIEVGVVLSITALISAPTLSLVVQGVERNRQRELRKELRQQSIEAMPTRPSN